MYTYIATKIATKKFCSIVQFPEHNYLVVKKKHSYKYCEKQWDEHWKDYLKVHILVLSCLI